MINAGRDTLVTMIPRTVIKLVTVSAVIASVSTPGTAAADTPESTWDRLVECEAGGDWHIDTGNGFYGGPQFTLSTWREYGGTGMPQDATRDEQIAVAERVLEGQGWGAWPVCSRKLGLR